MTGRRGFLKQLATLVAAGTAAPAVLAQLRPSLRAVPSLAITPTTAVPVAVSGRLLYAEMVEVGTGRVVQRVPVRDEGNGIYAMDPVGLVPSGNYYFSFQYESV